MGAAREDEQVAVAGVEIGEERVTLGAYEQLFDRGDASAFLVLMEAHSAGLTAHAPPSGGG